MSLPRLYFDIETSAQPIEQLEKSMPEFKPDSRLKDPAKIAESIAEKRQAYIDNAALSATTGQIIAFSYAIGDDEPVVTIGREVVLLNGASYLFEKIVSQNGCAYSFNGHGFDLPFLAQRGIANGKPALRRLLFTRFKGRTYPHETQIDVMREWCCGQDFRGNGLDAVAKALGLPGKTGSGKDFAKLLETDREAAIAYAKNDVALLRQIANKMNL